MAQVLVRDVDPAVLEKLRVRALFAGRRFGDSAELMREDRER